MSWPPKLMNLEMRNAWAKAAEKSIANSQLKPPVIKQIDEPQNSANVKTP